MRLPILAGIEPLRELPYKGREEIPVSIPMVDGMDPTKRFE